MPSQRMSIDGRLNCLAILYDRTDPLLLQDEIDQLLDQLFRLFGCQPGNTEDIFETLAYPDTP